MEKGKDLHESAQVLRLKKRSKKYRRYQIKKSREGNAHLPRRQWSRARFLNRKPPVYRIEFKGLCHLGSFKKSVTAARRFNELTRLLGELGKTHRRGEVLLDLQLHTGFDAPALVRFVQLLSFAEANDVRFRGLFPNDEKAMRQLADVGFLRDVPVMPTCVAMRIGYRPRVSIARELAYFLADKVIEQTPDGAVQPSRAKLIGAFYSPLFELTQNVYAHAGRQQRKVAWHAFGYSDPDDSGRATVVVGDVGVGIRASLRKKDQLLRRLFHADGKFIAEALKHGATSHAGKGRGKGLRELKSLAELGSELTVISGRGLVKISTYGIRHLTLASEARVPGTIVAFSTAPRDEGEE